MTTEPPRRRVRRFSQSRPSARGAAPAAAPDLTVRGDSLPDAPTIASIDPAADAGTPEMAVPAPPEAAAQVVHERPVAVAESQDLEHDAPHVSPADDRTGAWLPAGIVLLVVAFLLLCAALVLVASRQ